MEPKNQFRLDNAVQAWRSQFQSQSSIASDDLDELEVHLRDSFDELVELGLREEEAFWIARQRMGQPASLGSEFRKLHPSRLWTTRVCWMLVGFLSFRLVGELASVLSKTVAMVSSMMGLASGWSNSLAAILFLLPWIFFLGYLYRRCQDIGGAQAIPLSWILDKRPGLSAMLVALVFGSIYALGQGVTIIYYRTLSTLSGAELSSFHLTQTMMGLGLSCFLLVGGTLAIHRLRRRSV